jgi:hypothetical protein
LKGLAELHRLEAGYGDIDAKKPERIMRNSPPGMRMSSGSKGCLGRRSPPEIWGEMPAGGLSVLRAMGRVAALRIFCAIFTSSSSCSNGLNAARGLAGLFAAWYAAMVVSPYRLYLTAAQRMVSPSSSAACSSGGSSSLAMKSDARKSGLTRSTSTLASDTACRISSRHLLPPCMRVSSQIVML